MLSKIVSAVIRGIDAVPVTIETDLGKGMPSFNVVGLADVTVKEARERIRAAMVNSGLEYPRGRITINMSPAGIRKKGSHFDLSLAMGIVSASRQIAWKEGAKLGFIGELSLDGAIIGCTGILPMVMALKRAGVKAVVVPADNVQEAVQVKDMEIYMAESLMDLLEQLRGLRPMNTYLGNKEAPPESQRASIDFSDVKGQSYAKRAITVAVAGGHGILMTGSPATGKTMISERIPTIMPQMTEEEVLETTMIYSVTGLLGKSTSSIRNRPFRQPHHRITQAGLLGGGAVPFPGEVTLANKGVLFLDEVGEFERGLIDSLRTPLEKKKITLLRGGKTYTYPADFMLVAATNPCKCGYYGDPTHQCVCKKGEREKHKAKISGPILDRIDMHLMLQPLSFDDLSGEKTESSSEMREIINKARRIQAKRYIGTDICLNHQMDERLVEKYCHLDDEATALVSKAYDTLKLNPRTLLKVKKIARTIADLEGAGNVNVDHLAEALIYREVK